MNTKTIAGVVLLALFGFLLFRSFGAQVGGYMDFEEAERSGANAHVVGMWVEDVPFTYDRDANLFQFVMEDENGQRRTVRYNAPKPPNFEDADQVVIEGYAVDARTFEAQHILVKCPSKYNDLQGLEGTPVETTSAP